LPDGSKNSVHTTGWLPTNDDRNVPDDPLTTESTRIDRRRGGTVRASSRTCSIVSYFVATVVTDEVPALSLYVPVH
jgi:hypothetical protein